jgi:hypothetical protein
LPFKRLKGIKIAKIAWLDNPDALPLMEQTDEPIPDVGTCTTLSINNRMRHYGFGKRRNHHMARGGYCAKIKSCFGG